MSPRGALVVLLATAGCALAARDHACWPFLARQYHDGVPRDVVRQLARERGTRKTVRGQTAPIGFYWRHQRPGTVEMTEVHTVRDGYELAQCPTAIVVGPGGVALPPPR